MRPPGNAEGVDVVVLVTITYSTPDDVLLALKEINKPSSSG